MDHKEDLIEELHKLREENQRLAHENQRILRQRDETTRVFRNLFDKTPHIAVQGYSRERKLIYWNLYCEELYGYSKEEVLDRTWEELFIPEPMRQAAAKKIDAWVAQGEVMPPIEVVRRHKDGSQVPVYSQHVLVHTPQGDKEIYCLDIDLRELKRSEDLLEKTLILAVTDPLTGLYNRGYYNQTIVNEMQRARRDGKVLVYAMLDLDYFKKYNDTYGHLKGDELLTRLATVLKNHLARAGDHVFRMGGEEFLVLYAIDDPTDVPLMMDNLLMAIEDMNIAHRKNQPYGRVTSSAGVYLYRPEENLSADDLYSRADQALYAAKARGRNCCVFFHDLSTV
ncbi:sensor domain-containing diguanylate cyclase [uncultured Desulfuromonas sp.]|uniref:sensor domain-containing diguanylate cyclase n=1 Tax=uncultured Desulfuromonas sp. TaxID=181013 RepID=UPI002AAAA59F|nr:sensor domain-containing diguanylate cyclase [uncultured Desulfuromonas sp.]